MYRQNPTRNHIRYGRIFKWATDDAATLGADVNEYIGEGKEETDQQQDDY